MSPNNIGHRLSRLPLRLSFLLLALLVIAVILTTPGLIFWLPMALLAAPLAALSALALLTLPGLALLRLLSPGELRPAQYLAIALGISWAVPPLLLLGAEQIGVSWGPALSWTFLTGCGIVVVWPRRSTLIDVPSMWWDAELLLLLALFGMALAIRLYVVRDIPAGLFGDSYHHTLITQLLIDHGGLFRSWKPYTPLATMTYHFGFHSMAAWLHWLSDYPVLTSVVVVGQLAGALAVPGVFLITTQVFNDWRSALWGALAVGFLSVFPAYYVNWGRYTQLAGQTVLPATCCIWILLLNQSVDSAIPLRTLIRPMTLATIMTAGVALAHYRIGVFAVCFVIIYAIYLLVTRVRTWTSWVRMVSAGAIAGSLGIALTIPWLLRLRESRMLQLANHMVTTNVGTGTGNEQSPVAVGQAIANGMLPLAILGLVALLLRKHWIVLVLPLWAALVWLTANPYLLGMTGAGIISSFTVVIASYLWLAPQAGAGLAIIVDGTVWIITRFRPRFQTQARSSIELLLAVALIIWGLAAQNRILDPGYQLLTRADLDAAAWIREHLPIDTRIFVNSFPAYEGYVYAGTDGGWWLPLTSGRQTNLEPISYGFEAAEDPNYAEIVKERNDAILTHPLESTATALALHAWGYGYLYDGPAANPAQEYLNPTLLNNSPLYEQVYHRDGVTIWRVR